MKEYKLNTGQSSHETILFTGGLAFPDDEGFLYFKGHMDEMLKYKG